MVLVARQAQARRALGSLDYVRAIQAAVHAGVQQTELAEALGVHQGAISKLLSRAKDSGIKPIPDGFSGGSLDEIAQRFIAGEITKEVMVQELAAFNRSRTGKAY